MDLRHVEDKLESFAKFLHIRFGDLNTQNGLFIKDYGETYTTIDTFTKKLEIKTSAEIYRSADLFPIENYDFCIIDSPSIRFSAIIQTIFPLLKKGAYLTSIFLNIDAQTMPDLDRLANDLGYLTYFTPYKDTKSTDVAQHILPILYKPMPFATNNELNSSSLNSTLHYEISRNKRILQSSISSWQKNVFWSDYNVLSGFFTEEFSIHTEFESSPWIIIDLKELFEIRQIRLYNRKKFEKRILDIIIYVSTDLMTWEQVCINKDFFGGIYDNKPLIINLIKTSRYVRIEKSSPGFLHFDQIQVFGVI